MVQLPWSDFFKESIHKAFGPLLKCNPNVDQEDNYGEDFTIFDTTLTIASSATDSLLFALLNTDV